MTTHGIYRELKCTVSVCFPKLGVQSSVGEIASGGGVDCKAMKLLCSEHFSHLQLQQRGEEIYTPGGHPSPLSECSSS